MNEWDAFPAVSSGRQDQGWDAFPPAKSGAPTFNERFAADEAAPLANRAALKSGLENKAVDMTTGPRVGPSHSLAIDMGNILSGAQQGTTSQMSAHRGNLLSTDVYRGDDNTLSFKNPETGQIVPTDQKAHVVLLDPADNRYKVYARSAQSDAGPLESVSKVMTAGMMAGAPTVRPSVASGIKATAPTVQQLKDAYKAAKDSPVVEAVQIAPQAMTSQADTIMAELSNKKFSASRAPQTFGLLAELRGAPLGQLDAPGVNVTMANVDDFRYQLGLIAGGQGPDAAAAQLAKAKLDAWVPKIASADTIAGDPAAAHAVMQGGRQDYTAAKLGEALDKRIAKAELQTGATHSGMNLQNQLRQKAVQFLNSPDSSALSATERRVMEEFAKGTAPQNILRFIGKKLGNVFTTGAGMTGGALLGGPAGAAAGLGVGAVGYGMQKLSNVLTARQAEQLSEMIRSRSPLGQGIKNSVEAWQKYAEMAAKNPTSPRAISMLNITSRNLSNNLGSVGISIDPAKLQGTVRGAAEEEQAEPIRVLND